MAETPEKKGGPGVPVDVAALKAAREAKGWSQKELAKRIGCNPRNIERAESGGTAALTTLKEIAEALGVTVDSIRLARTAVPSRGADDAASDVSGKSVARLDPVGDQQLKQSALADPNLYRFLEWYHEIELWEQHGHKYPLVSYPIREDDQPNEAAFLAFDRGPEALPSGKWSQIHEHGQLKWALQNPGELAGAFAPGLYDSDLIARRLDQNRGMLNNPTFCLRQLDTDGPRVVGGLVGRYFDAVATCDALEEELLLAWGKHRPPSEKWATFARDNLPRREALKRHCVAGGVPPHLTGAGRSAAIAVATLTVYRKFDQRKGIDEYRAFVRARSAWVANHPHMLHVVPSGMFQPTRDWDLDDPGNAAECRGEWDIRHHIYRELVEELFNTKPDEVAAMTSERFYSLPDVQNIHRRIESGPSSAEILTPAVIVNMLNLRTELCTLLLIHDPDWYRSHQNRENGTSGIMFNEEYMTDEELKAAKQSRVWFVTVWDKGAPIPARRIISESLAGDASPSRFVPPGAAALWLGIDAAQRRIRQLGESRSP